MRPRGEEPLGGPPTVGAIERFMTADHVRLDRLLDRACAAAGEVDAALFAEFREGLLRHIAMEEKVLLPYARERRGGDPLPMARTMRRDHGEIAALLVPSPTPEGCDRLRDALARHNPLEEGREGLYATCDGLAGAEGESLVERLRSQPRVPVAPHYDGPLLRPRGAGGA